MTAIFRKEINQFFSSLTGYMAIILFLIVNGLYLFVLKDSNIFDFGYATLSSFFDFAPWVLAFLIPALCMRIFPDEFKTGTFEILSTQPLTGWRIVWGKYLAALLIVFISILPTLLYAITLQSLSASGALDGGSIAGSYLGLFLLAAVFAAISIWCSSLTDNSVVAFLISVFACLLLYFGFSSLSKLPVFTGNADYYIEMAGINFHYQSISRGVINSRDLIYFFSLIYFFLFLTQRDITFKKGKK
ncbi:MAG: ABC transporter permease subunit [Ginsengibacter sp.]